MSARMLPMRRLAIIGVVVALAVLTGCTPERREAAPVAAERPARCDVRTPVVNAPDVLTVADVGPTETGGASVTDVDVRACAASVPLAWRCDLVFPWQTTADLGPAMAALRVTRARVAYVVTPGRSLTETILEVDPTGGDARALARRLADACDGSSTTVSIRATGPVLVGVDFSQGRWTPTERRSIVRTAVARVVG